MDTKWPYNAFTMIKPEKQQTDFRFTPQGSKHEKNKIAITFLLKKYFKILQFKHVLCLMSYASYPPSFFEKGPVWFNLS